MLLVFELKVQSDTIIAFIKNVVTSTVLEGFTCNTLVDYQNNENEQQHPASQNVSCWLRILRSVVKMNNVTLPAKMYVAVISLSNI